MESLPSSFLQKYSLSHTPSSPPPTTPIFHFKISSVTRIDEKHARTSHHTTFPPQKRPKDSHNFTPKNEKISKIFNALDNLITELIDLPLRPSIDPRRVLSGNFSPVPELPPTACHVAEGALPESLNGAYIRNGPNPQFIPRGPYHLFDGDGMLHALTISNGRATLCSRFVKTYKYNLEKATGSPVILNVFSAFNGLPASLARCSVALARYLLRQYDPRRGIGAANTSLAVVAGSLFALWESDLPYRVRLLADGDVVTIGRHDAFGEPFMTMTAHPKVDPDTGGAFAFRHSIRAPYLSFFRITAEGIKLPEIPIDSLKEASLVHDFAITKSYAVFPDPQIVIQPAEILKGKAPLFIDAAKVARLGIIPRYAESDGEMWWVEIPGFNMVHAVNAWEEDGGDTVVVVASNVKPVEHVLDHLDLVHSSFERVEINVREKSVRRRPVAAGNLDFGVINPAYSGKKNRYVSWNFYFKLFNDLLP